MADSRKHIVIDNLQLGYGTETILNINHLVLRRKIITGILGPSGGGKSTFLKLLSRLDQNNPILWSQGTAVLDSKNILEDNNIKWAEGQIVILQQKARFYGGKVFECILDGIVNINLLTEKRIIRLCYLLCKPIGLWEIIEPHLNNSILEMSLGFHKLIMIAKLCAKNPAYILIDEPFRDFAIVEEPLLISLLRKLKKRFGILLVTHNKKHAKSICDEIVLLSGGQLIEHTSAKCFFSNPKQQLSKQFLLSGSAWPDVSVESSSNDVDLPQELKLKKQFPRLSSFYWIIPGMIGGVQKPGLLSDEEEDIRRLNAIKVDYLISLTQKPVEVGKYPFNEIKGLHFPIIDMKAPSLEATYNFLKKLTPELRNKKSAIFHCKAGIGRTGTMLACCLVFMGETAPKAIERVRTVFYRYIQSDEQLQFIEDFAQYCAQPNAALLLQSAQ